MLTNKVNSVKRRTKGDLVDMVVAGMVGWLKSSVYWRVDGWGRWGLIVIWWSGLVVLG